LITRIEEKKFHESWLKFDGVIEVSRGVNDQREGVYNCGAAVLKAAEACDTSNDRYGRYE